MSGVIIDSKELRDFASELSRYNQELTSATSHLNANFRRLGETWRDPAYGRFGQEFEQMLANIRRFQKVSEDVIPKLRAKADRVDQVHHG